MKFGSLTPFRKASNHTMPPKKAEPWFKVELSASAAIERARRDSKWDELASAIETLSVARTRKCSAAHNGKRVRIIQSQEEADSVHEDGRYLVQPPLVGRDAALLDNRLKQEKISCVVACREPSTKLGLCPIVALGSGVTVRVQVEEPKNPEKPTCAWFDHALEELGDHIVDQAEKLNTPTRQLDFLLAHVAATPTHIGVYRAAIERCSALSSGSV